MTDALTTASIVPDATFASADDFRAVFRGHPGGVAVITADGENGPAALTATSVASVSVDPPTIVFSLSGLSSATPTLRTADTVVVHLLDADDVDVARLAATSGIDRFADRTRWTRLVTGEPVFHGVRAWLRCRIVERVAAGGSTVVVATALQSHVERDSDAALAYHDRAWHRLDGGSLVG